MHPHSPQDTDKFSTLIAHHAHDQVLLKKTDKLTSQNQPIVTTQTSNTHTANDKYNCNDEVNFTIANRQKTLGAKILITTFKVDGPHDPENQVHQLPNNTTPINSQNNENTPANNQTVRRQLLFSSTTERVPCILQIA